MELHRCRFIDWVPEEAESLSFNPEGTHLSVGRRNGDVELYSTADWFHPLVIPGDGPSTARALAWAPRSRLFSAGLNGIIAEWSVDNLTRVRETTSNGGAVFGLAVNPDGNCLAAACEDGAVRLFDLSDSSLVLQSSLVRGKGRLLSVCWSADGRTVYAGGACGAVAGWDAKSGRRVFGVELDSLRGGNDGKVGGAVVVWSVACVGGTVVTGDSRGKTQFWDAATGTLLHSFQEHQADVLAVAAGASGDVVFSSGVDSRLCMFQITTATSGSAGPAKRSATSADQWQCRGGIRSHTHDVKAIAVFGDAVVTAGTDSRLVVHSSESFLATGQSLRTLSPVPHANPLVSVAAAPGLLLARFPRALQLWRIGSPKLADAYPATQPHYHVAVLPIADAQQHLLDFDLATARSSLSCSAISSEGKFIACSDRFLPRLFRLTVGTDDDSTAVRLERVRLPSTVAAAYRVAFTPDERTLVVAQFGGGVAFVDISGQRTKVASVVPTPLSYSLAVSPSGKWVAAAFANGTVGIFDTAGGRLECTIPSLGGLFTAMAFTCDSTSLVLTTSDFRYHVWSVNSRALTDFSRTLNSVDSRVLPSSGRDLPLGIAVNASEPSRVYVYGSTWLCRAPIDSIAKAADGVLKEVSREVRPKGRYNLILAAGFVGMDKLALVERPWRHVLQKLPEPINFEHFGI